MDKKIAFIHSSFERIPGDYYPTIDPRCIDALLQVVKPQGLIIDPCAPMGSGIVDRLRERGYTSVGLPDAFEDGISAEWIVTNPPFIVPLVDHIVERTIRRVEEEEIAGAAFLLRAYFDHAKGRADLFAHPCYAGQIKLTFRPLWKKKEPGDKGPIHNFVWHIWTRLELPPASGSVWYSREGE